MDVRFVLNASVTHADVDRDQLLLLPRLFKLLQEVAIRHANQYGTGTNAVTERNESWVLNRIAIEVLRYPSAEEPLRVETWSCGVRGFKGHRDFRVFGRDEELLVAGSSLWLYISLASGAIIRVPREIAATFPVDPEPARFPTLEADEYTPPGATACAAVQTLRYSDFDVNQHVNNAAYLDLVQTALTRHLPQPRPLRIAVKYSRAIPPHTTAVTVRSECEQRLVRFSIEADGTTCALGVAHA